MAEAKRRRIDSGELKKILADHRMWMESEGAEGHRADLRSSHLVIADLFEAYLRRADLSGSDLNGADLRGADIHGADFRETVGLKPEQIKRAENWETAIYDDELAEELGLK